MANPFLTHHTAAGKAHAAGDHAKTMHHIGHMMRITKSATATTAPTAPTTRPTPPQAMAAGQMGSEPDQDDPMTTTGISTPAPTPAQHFFGQAPTRPKPPAPKAKAKGFDKSRFASLKGR